MTDDFFIDDVLGNLPHKKKINSKSKGARGELEICKFLSQRFKDKGGFFRVVGSGNRWSQVTLTEQAKGVLIGDISAPTTNWKFTIEVKYGYPDIDLLSSFDNGHKKLDEFLDQAEKDASRASKQPMLCWKKPRQEWVCFLKQTDASDVVGLTYKLYYRNWIAMSLQKLLEMDDGWFFTPLG